jgi:hypothetical protein
MDTQTMKANARQTARKILSACENDSRPCTFAALIPAYPTAKTSYTLQIAGDWIQEQDGSFKPHRDYVIDLMFTILSPEERSYIHTVNIYRGERSRVQCYDATMILINQIGYDVEYMRFLHLQRLANAA